MLTESQAIDRAQELLRMRAAEAERLTKIHDYRAGQQKLLALPQGVPTEVRRLAQISRVNLLGLVVKAYTQSMYVDGYRLPRAGEDVPAWDVWVRNQLAARQIGIHKAAISYGAAYATVLPGDPVPVIRGASPRQMTVAYGDDDTWPRFALQKRKEGWRLLDEQAVYFLSVPSDTYGEFRLDDVQVHGATDNGEPVCPVVRYRESTDLDDEVVGVIEPLILLQDQIDVTSFGLLVAQHYGAFKQRYVLGWIAESEEQLLKTSADKFLTFEDHPNDIKVGQFDQTDPSGYISSREASIRHLASISQTPAHELIGQLANLSAEALAAAEAAHRRAVTEIQTVMGGSHEQLLGLAGEMQGEKTDPAAYVRWRDTESRSLSQVADALGKLADQLGVPQQELWSMIPGVSDNEIERWKATAAEGDALTNLTELLSRQAAGDGALAG